MSVRERPMQLIERLDTDTVLRLLSKVEIGADGHWRMPTQLAKVAPPQIQLDRNASGTRHVSARRALWVLYSSEPLYPDEFVIVVCGERRCLNPAHMRISHNRAGESGRPWRRPAPPPAPVRRHRRPGQPRSAYPLRDFNALQRLYARVEQRPDGHWHRRSETDTLRIKGHMHSLVRLLYASEQGVVVPFDRYLIRTCEDRACINPAHRIVGDSSERAAHIPQNQPRTHCRRGLHELTPDNLRLTTRGKRYCLTCARAADRQRKRSSRALAAKKNAC